MHLNTASALAVLAIAAQAAAEYEPLPHLMSSRDIFGLAARDGGPGYQPTQTFCGTGSTCAQACGAGFVMCPSTDNSIHCYNQAIKQACCSDGSGNSCDPGFFCAASKTNGTLCCPEGQSLDACAKAYGVAPGLSSEVPASYTASSSSVYPTASAVNSTYAVPTGSYSTGSGATYPTSNTTKSAPTPSATKVSTNAGSLVGPAGASLAIAAAIFAALL